MTDFPRLIEHAFPLKQASLDSVHEKNVRHGHISTLHIWPARRPLAACRAALIATLLPDPGDAEERRKLCEKIGGKIVKRVEKKKMPDGQSIERMREETQGGILHWGRETSNADGMDWFRKEIRKAYGGRAPKVLDPFAGGGAIPLEAMRLGCEAAAVDINPVAWFILKCTLEYPQKLAGKKHPLPDFILDDDAFMLEFLVKTKGCAKAQAISELHRLRGGKHAPDRRKPDQQGDLGMIPGGEAGTSGLDADLAWHVRAWGQWVLARARRELARYYPTFADFAPIKDRGVSYEMQPMRLIPPKEDGTVDAEALNREFSNGYMDGKGNPRWIAKPAVAYLWARTVKCKNCRALTPLLKTRWLCKKPGKRVLLTMAPNGKKDGVAFGVHNNVPVEGGKAAQKRENDKRLGAGTMSRAGVKCPCCGAINTMEDIRLEGKAGRLGAVMTAVVVDGPKGKEYRLPMALELEVAAPSEADVEHAFADVPFGIPDEPLPSADALGMRIPLYGFTKWRDLFTPRQLMALGTFTAATRAAQAAMDEAEYPPEWREAVGAYLGILLDKNADYNSTVCTWHNSGEKTGHTFARFALPMTWDFIEGVLVNDVGGSCSAHIDWLCRFIEHALYAQCTSPIPALLNQSSQQYRGESFDAIVTDPPYYDAIPYSDLMDFFYVWLKRATHGLSPEIDRSFAAPLSPKWDHDTADGELIDDSSRHGGDRHKAKAAYEAGMQKVFERCHSALKHEGRLVVVFANKQPDAWETLVSAIIGAGFAVNGSWPIQTEMGTRQRAMSSAALASSVWLVCKKRPPTARAGWDNQVLAEMKTIISQRLRDYWDAGIRGPDFVWAATGPAMEAFSKHPAVRKTTQPDAIMGIGEFLSHVRRMVVDYIVGQVLSAEGGAGQTPADVLDEVTSYYLLHRNDFGMDEAPVGACILYATACGQSDTRMEKVWDILTRAGGDSSTFSEDDEEEVSEDENDRDGGGGGKVRLKPWNQRMGKNMGYDAPEGRAVPLIDRIHRVMHLWKQGDVQKVDEYLEQYALRRNELFKRVVQSLIELSENNERSLLESISNHVGAKGAAAAKEHDPGLWDKKDGDELL